MNCVNRAEKGDGIPENSDNERCLVGALAADGFQLCIDQGGIQHENINHENDRVRVGSGHGEYSLQAVGWVRVVAGAQALLSVYLLAMWVLTQFGQPFE